jgi:flagellar FliL protein
MEATEEIADAPSAEGADAAPRKKSLPLLAVIAVGLIVGGGAGLFVAGPLIAKKLTSRSAATVADSTTHGEGAKEGKDGKDGKEATKTMHIVDNLVLNPAQSGGTRFLMVTATFELKDGAAEEAMKSRDAEVRDALLALLGRKTVEQLTDISVRDQIKSEVIASVAPLFPKGSVKRVYFPQFVIQ